MTAETRDRNQRSDRKDEPKPGTPESAPGTETQKKGGTEPAKRQAERDWQDSAKESGD